MIYNMLGCTLLCNLQIRNRKKKKGLYNIPHTRTLSHTLSYKPVKLNPTAGFLDRRLGLSMVCAASPLNRVFKPKQNISIKIKQFLQYSQFQSLDMYQSRNCTVLYSSTWFCSCMYCVTWFLTFIYIVIHGYITSSIVLRGSVPSSIQSYAVT